MRARNLGRTSAHRLAMYRNLVTSLLEHEHIETTDAKAKEVRRLADRMITLGKRGDLHARRRALRVIRTREVAAKVFGELAERYRTRPGGYTRVLKTRRRVGDSAAMSIVEMVESLEAPKAEKKPKKKTAARKKVAAKATAEKKPAKKAAAKKTATKKKTAKKKTSKKKTAKKATRKKTASKTSKKKTTKSKTSRSKSD
jgi:large subunit ribosomal protein L17